MKIYKAVAFSDFYQLIQNEHMNLSLAYKFNKIINSLEKDVNFYREELRKIFDECVEKQEDGTYRISEDGENFILIPDKIEIFNKKYNELRNIDIENPTIHFSFDELNELTITPAELMMIDDFIIQE